MTVLSAFSFFFFVNNNKYSVFKCFFPLIVIALQLKRDPFINYKQTSSLE